jgi:hypothetical protein
MDDKKAELPFGWIVKQSKTYPDRVYYFNVNSGASSWEFPDLLQHYVVFIYFFPVFIKLVFFKVFSQYL